MFDMEQARIIAEEAPKLKDHRNSEAYILPALILKKACDEIDYLKDEVTKAVSYLKEGKKKMGIVTTNSFVDDFIARHSTD